MPRGSVRSRKLKSGETVYDLIYDTPPPPGKSRAQAKEVFRGKKKDAQAEVAKRVAEAWGDGVAVDRDITLGQFLDEWLAHYQRRQRPASYAAREQIVRLHIKPELGHLRLAQLGPRAIQRWLDGREAGGFAANYRRDMLGTLRAALNHAVAMEIATRNAAAAIQGPPKGEPVGKSWTVEEARAFLEAERAGENWPLWVVAQTAQLRRAELVGLRWEDVDFDRGLIRVERQLIPVTGGGLRIAPPKTARSKRILPMPVRAMAALRRQQASQEARRAILEPAGRWKEDGWVFDGGDGRPMNPHTPYNRFVAACERIGVTPIRLHDLRTTGITLMGQAGVQEWTIQQRAGHADIETTRAYAHPAVELQRVAAELLADLLGLGGEDVVIEERPGAGLQEW